MAITLVAHTIKGSSNTDSVTTDAIDISGSNLLVAAVSWFDFGSIGSVNDNLGNMVYAGLTAKSSGNRSTQLYYFKNPVVGSGYMATVGGSSGFPSIAILAFSGADTSSPFDVENGATGLAVSSLQPGSITPTANNEVLVAALGNALDTVSIDGGFTISDQHAADGSSLGLAAAYLIQTTAASANPTLSWTIARDTAAVIASFKSGAVVPDPLSFIARN